MLEIEISGPIASKKQVLELVKKFESQRYKTLRFSEAVVFFKNSHDLRIKWEADKPDFELVYKTRAGSQRSVRREISLHISKGQLKSLLKLLEMLGIKRGFVSQAERTDIITRNTIWSFKFKSVIGNYFEAEATGYLIRKLKYRRGLIKKYLRNAANQLGFKVWSENEFRKVKHRKRVKIRPRSLAQLARALQ